ncbi:MAG: Methyltransferase protein [Arthrobacter sp.]|nr:Methyltransferase protein [Arthrobacter sp.]MCU1548993.1 Methyltransferase protein [Arthrobacter sp.]
MNGPAGLRKTADTFQLIVRVAALSFRLPRRPDRLWKDFWRGISEGSLREPVIWDAARGQEMEQLLERATGALNTGLPVVDIGCGTGPVSRRLAEVFPSVLGIDVSPEAVAAAKAASVGIEGLAFRSLDATRQASVTGLARELGDVNVFVRGVFHVLSRRRQLRLVRAIELLLGSQGRVYLVETNVPGGSLNYLRGLGATGTRIPGPLRQAIATLPKPGHFGALQRSRVFPAHRWTLIADGPATVETVPMETGGPPGRIPGYWAVLGRREPQPQSS